jgi:hypothetical protein
MYDVKGMRQKGGEIEKRESLCNILQYSPLHFKGRYALLYITNFSVFYSDTNQDEEL